MDHTHIATKVGKHRFFKISISLVQLATLSAETNEPADIYRLQLAHVDDGTDAVARLHGLESVVHLTQRLAVGDELVHLERTLEVVAHQVAHLAAALDASKGTALPHTAGHKLEC
jgi:hypothetical protein